MPQHVCAHFVSSDVVATFSAFPATGCWEPVGVDVRVEVGAPGDIGAPVQDLAAGAVEEGNDNTCICLGCDRYTGAHSYN